MSALPTKLRNNDKSTRAALVTWFFFYLSAVSTRLIIKPSSVLIYLIMDAALLGLIYWIYDMTKKRTDTDRPLKNPLLELVCVFIIGMAISAMLPKINIAWWNLGEIARKNSMFTLPFILTVFFTKSSIQNFTIIRNNIKKDILLGAIVTASLVIPSLFYSNTYAYLKNSPLSLSQLLTVILAGFVFWMCMAGLPEELFYRACIQRRLGEGLQSPWAGLLFSALLFGIMHTAGNQSWGYGTNFFDGMAESVFVQSFFGLIFGVLYMRTKNIVLCIVVHSFVNTATNIASIAERLGY